ncbi:hypothetical protein HRbin16_03300 [bacterium HR16]|nr:hypothetical protein HRbin16_03300 [bacterium HR16]
MNERRNRLPMHYLVAVGKSKDLRGRLHREAYLRGAGLRSGVFRLDENKAGSVLIQPAVRTCNRLLVQRGNKAGLTIRHCAILPRYHRHRQPSTVQMPFRPLRLAVRIERLNLRLAFAECAVTLYDELAVVARQREHYRSVVLHLVVRLLHRLRESLFRHLAYTLQYCPASCNPAPVLLDGQVGVAGDQQPGMGHVHHAVRQHIVHRHAERAVREADAQNRAVGKEHGGTAIPNAQTERRLSIPCGFVHRAGVLYNLAVVDADAHLVWGVQAKRQFCFIPARDGESADGFNLNWLGHGTEYPAHLAHAVRGS